MNARESSAGRESLGDSLAHLGRDLADLFRAELTLFKKEAQQELGRFIVASIWLGAGVLTGLAALGALTALAIIALSLVLAPWAAALIVTAAWGLTAASLIAAARIKLQSALPIQFDQTTRSVKEDIEWIKSGAKSAP